MMRTRLALGSVSAMAVAALLLGVTPYVFSRVMGSTQATPWGAISPLSIGQSEAAEDDRAKLLQLAALKTNGDTVPVQPIATVLSGDTPAAAPLIPAEASFQAAVPASNPAISNGVDAEQPLAVAAVDPSPDAAATGARTLGGASGLININTASTDTLDRLPGAGRIGHAIVSHRPYRAINDLVRKRVLRMSDYQRIQSRIRTD